MKPLLSFSRPFKSEEEVEISFSEACSSVIAFGATGSGKTTGVLQPAFYSLVSQNCSGMVFDLKGDYLALARTLVPKDRLLILGTTADSEPCNLIAGMTVEVFRSFMETLKDHGGMRRDPYWGTGAVRDSILIFRSYQIFKRREPTLAEVYEALEGPERFCNWLDLSVESAEYLPDDYLRLIDACKAEHFSILSRGCSVVLGDEDAALGVVDPEVKKQYAWHTSVLCSKFRAFSENPVLRAKLCVPAGPDAEITRRIYEENAVVIVSIPATHFAKAAHVACTLLRDRFYNDVLNTTRSYRREHGVGAGRHTFMMIDEYQNFIKVNSGSNSAGLIDDNTWFDKSRAYHHINILASQGVVSLKSQADSNSVDSLLQNIRTKIYFPTDDPHTLNRVQASGGDIAVNSLICPSDEGHCYIHKATRKPFFGAALSGQSRHSFMSAFIRFPVEPSSEVVSVKSNSLVRNPDFTPSLKDDFNQKIVFVCSTDGGGEKKLRHALMEEFQDLSGSGYDISELASRIKIESVEILKGVPSSTASAIALVKTLIFKNPGSTLFFDDSISGFVTLNHLKSFHMEPTLRNIFAEEIAILADKYNVKLCRSNADRNSGEWFKDSNYEMSEKRVCYNGVSSFLKYYCKQELQLKRVN